MLFTDRGKDPPQSRITPDHPLEWYAALKIEVLKNEVMIGLRNFSEKSKVAQANVRSSQGTIRSLEK